MLITIGTLLLVATVVSAYQTWDDVDIQVVDSWTDPGGNGEDLRFDVSPDGSRIVMAGHTAANDVLVTDRDMNVLATLVPPEQDLVIEGVRWSINETWVCAWGSNDSTDHDLLWIWNASTYELTEELFENHTTPLTNLDSVLFMAFDEILVLAGRDVNGTSRVIIWQTVFSTMINDIPWEDNATVVHLGTDMMEVLCIDERGDVTSISSDDWLDTRDLGGYDAYPTANVLNVYDRQPNLVGYDDGTAIFWGGYPTSVENSTSFGDGPVQAVSWVFVDGSGYYLLATPSSEGGAQIGAFFYSVDGQPANPVSGPVIFPDAMTKMVKDVLVKDQVWCGFNDGTITLLSITTIPNLPPEVTIEAPEEREKIKGNFLAYGSYSDDRDRIEYVRVRWADRDWTMGAWEDADFSNGSWSYEVNVSTMRPSKVRLEVEVYDGRHYWNEYAIFDFVQEREDDDDGKWRQGIPGIPMALAILAVALYLMVRAYKKKWEA